MKINVLKGKMRECGLTQAKAAEEIGISESRFNAKLNENSAVFNLNEAKKLKEILGLSDEQSGSIFLG